MGLKQMPNQKRQRSATQQPSAAGAEGFTRFAVVRPVLAPLCVVAVGLCVYSNSFAGVFLLDDVWSIELAPEIRHLWPFAHPWALLNSGSLVSLSLAANYALGELDPWGYHLFNLVVHLSAGLALYGLVRRTLLLPGLEERYGRRAAGLALAVALLWLVHPLQTESVTYVCQRSEAMMGLFYLLTLYCVLRGARSEGRARWWGGAAVCCCALGMASKEVMVTAPLLVLLYDRVFLVGSLRELLRRRGFLYLGLAAGWVFVAGRAASVLGLPGAGVSASVGFGIQGVTLLQYARSQPGIILHYLRLVFWPDSLCLDYAWEAATSLSDILLPAVAVGVFVAVTLWVWWRWPGLGYCGAWFLLILIPTSSVVPLKDLAFEHRVYLPMASLAVLVILGGEAALNRQVRDRVWRKGCAAALLMGLAAVLGWRTVQRNEDYRSKVTMYRDIVAKRSENGRAHNNLSVELLNHGQVADAIHHLREALRISPDYFDAHMNLGNAFVKERNLSEAIIQYREALRISPNAAKARVNLGNVLLEAGKPEEAIDEFRESLRLEPESVLAHYALANALFGEGKVDEAIVHYRDALGIMPTFAPAHANLARTLMSQGRTADAIPHYREALRIQPGIAFMHNDLGSALLLRGEWAEATTSFRRAVALRPRESAYHVNLAYALHQQGRADEGRAEYRVASTLSPGWPQAYLRDAWTLATHRDQRNRSGLLARQTVERVLQAVGDRDPRVLDTLAASFAESGQFDSAVHAARAALERARADGQTERVKEIQGRVSLYERRLPFRTAGSR